MRQRPRTTLTAPGSLLGTLPYMAPEQLEGASGDERTDIWAFGAVLYEMASGSRAFRGDSQASLIAAILNRDPEPLASVQPNVPADLDRLIRKCLAKDPDARWQSASDVADELRWIAGGKASRAAGPQVSGQRRTARWAAIAIALLLAVAAGASIWRWRSAVRPGAPEVQQQQVTFSGDIEMSALSPDGRTVAYVPGGFDRVLVRELSGGQASPIWTGKGVMALSWLPDGSHLVVIEGNRSVWIVPRLGGAARRVADSGRMAAPSADGASLALTADGLVGFYTLSLAGGETRVVTLTGFGGVLAIDWHAHTNRVVLMTPGDDEKVWNVWSVAPDGRDQLRLFTGNQFNRAICSSPVSDVVYVMRDQLGSMDLLRVPVFPRPWRRTRLLTRLPVTAMGYRCTVSADGRRLLYGRRSSLLSLWRLNIARPTTQATPLTHGNQVFHPAVSPDGLWIAGTAGPEVAAQVVKIPVGGGEPVRLGDGALPVWSPDGRQLAFTSRRSGSPRVWISGANGQWPKEVKDSAVGPQRPIWLPDGRLAWQTPDRQNYRIRDLLTGRDGSSSKTPRFLAGSIQCSRHGETNSCCGRTGRTDTNPAYCCYRGPVARNASWRDKCGRSAGPRTASGSTLSSLLAGLSCGCHRERTEPKQSANSPLALVSTPATSRPTAVRSSAVSSSRSRTPGSWRTLIPTSGRTSGNRTRPYKNPPGGS